VQKHRSKPNSNEKVKPKKETETETETNGMSLPERILDFARCKSFILMHAE
jgi:hypothetical protein